MVYILGIHFVENVYWLSWTPHPGCIPHFVVFLDLSHFTRAQSLKPSAFAIILSSNIDAGKNKRPSSV